MFVYLSSVLVRWEIMETRPVETASQESALQQVNNWDVPFVAAGAVNTSAVVTVGNIDERVPVASITKLLTAYACIVAWEEGALELDAPTPDEGVTIRHLLAHTGGYHFDDHVQLSPAGTRRMYSNTSFVLLANELSQAVGFPAVEYVNEAVVQPLGLSSTTFDDSVIQLAAGGSSTVRDLTVLAQEFLAPTLVTPASWESARQVQFPGLAGVVPGWGSYDPCDWGLGMELKGTKDPHWMGATAPPTCYGHFGGAGSMMWIDPEINAALIAVTNRPFGTWANDAWPGFSDDMRAELSSR